MGVQHRAQVDLERLPLPCDDIADCPVPATAGDVAPHHHRSCFFCQLPDLPKVVANIVVFLCCQRAKERLAFQYLVTRITLMGKT